MLGSDRILYLRGLRLVKREILDKIAAGLAMEVTDNSTCQTNNPHHWHVYQAGQEQGESMILGINGFRYGPVIRFELGHPCGIVFFRPDEVKYEFGVEEIFDFKID